MKTKTQKNRSSKQHKKTKQYRKSIKSKTMKRGAGFFDSFTKATQQYTNQDPNQQQNQQQPKKYGNTATGITTAVMRSAKAYNMPAILGAMSSKINALLIHNKVNYQFSNGYNARDYDINTVPAAGDNDGRGILKQNAVRGEITGVQSKLYNQGLDKYNQMKNKNNNTNQMYNSNQNQNNLNQNLNL